MAVWGLAIHPQHLLGLKDLQRTLLHADMPAFWVDDTTSTCVHTTLQVMNTAARSDL